MSFEDLQKSGTRSSRSAPPPLQVVSAAIFQIKTAVAGFRRLVDAIGTSRDTPDHRHNLNNARQRILRLVKETSAIHKFLSEFDHGIDVHPNKKTENVKLARFFETVLQEFQKLQQLASERESIFSSLAPPSSVPLMGGSLCSIHC